MACSTHLVMSVFSLSGRLPCSFFKTRGYQDASSGVSEDECTRTGPTNGIERVLEKRFARLEPVNNWASRHATYTGWTDATAKTTLPSSILCLLGWTTTRFNPFAR